MKQIFTTIAMVLMVSLGIAQNDTTSIYLANVNITNESAVDAADGAIDITVAGGEGYYNYSWGNSEGSINIITEDVTGLIAGVYYVEVWEGNDQASFTFTVAVEGGENPIDTTETDPCFGFYATTNVTYVTSPDATDGAIDLTVFGGEAPYTYNWETGETTEDLFYLAEGYYEVLVEDANGCATYQSDYVYYYNDNDTNMWDNPVDTFEIEEPIDSCFEVTVNSVVIEEYEVIEDSISITWNLYDIDGNLIATFSVNYNGEITEAGVYNFDIVFVECNGNNKAMNSGASYSGQLYIDPAVATGVKQINTISSEFNIYPNPAKDILTIKGQNISTVEIMDINGKIVKTINNASNGTTVNVSSLTQGIYFVKMGNKVQKLVKL